MGLDWQLCSGRLFIEPGVQAPKLAMFKDFLSLGDKQKTKSKPRVHPGKAPRSLKGSGDSLGGSPYDFGEQQVG